ncbi:MAG TPA: PepSY domain-containing protein [Phycisphaerae bacterium]|nr:PepSY domain-containing protein [Phycisphaerae bacterium]
MKTRKLIVILAAVSLAGCAPTEQNLEEDKPIALSEVPAKAREAAAAAVEGIVLTGAEVEREAGRLVYEIKGEANGKKYEIEVTADGKVLEVEPDDD